jgi:3-oxoacyl-[acyl-carrier protein] reductase
MIIEQNRILITGGAGFFGQFLCKYLLDVGAEKVFLVDLSFDNIEVSIRDSARVELIVCDLTRTDDVSQMMNKLFDNDYFDVLINNAGYIHSELLINVLNKNSPVHAVDNWEKVIALNLTTCFLASSNAAIHLVKRKRGGLIINISSIAAKGNLGQSAYSAAKAGVEAMTKVWAKELGMFKIRSVCVAPGFIDTPSTHQSLSEAVVEKWRRSISIGRFGDLEEIGKTIKFVIENDYLNGTVISIDGGLTI